MPERLSVRHWLRQQTDGVHQALHGHRLLGPLVSPDVSRSAYLAALRVFHNVFAAVEQRRAAVGIYPRFALKPAVDALTLDLRRGPAVAELPKLDSDAVLGALYVAHGAAFGGAVIGRNIAQVLPEAPRAYFGQERAPDLWTALVSEMEAHGGAAAARARLEAGAQAVFAAVAQQADAALEEATCVSG